MEQDNKNNQIKKKTPLVCYTLPKAEMHVHISIALSSEIFLRRIKDRRTPLTPDFLITQNSRYYKDLKEHHDTYEGMRHLTKTHRELSSTVQDYLERISREGCIYAELSYSFRDENKFEGQMEALAAGIEAAKYNKGIEARIVVTAIRDQGGEHATKVAKYLAKNPHKYVTGFGLVGDEGLNPFTDFAESLHVAWHEAGLGLTPHVAEQHPRNAINFLEALPKEALVNNKNETRRLRVGHGTLIHMSSEMMEEFADKNICMEVCLSANKRLGLPQETKDIKQGDVIPSTSGDHKDTMDLPLIDYYNDIRKHPIDVFKMKGIPLCLGSDNPLLMNTNIGKEYSLAVKAGYGDHHDVLDLTRNAIKFANVDLETRVRLMSHIDIYEAKIKNGDAPTQTALGYRRAFKSLNPEEF